MDRRGFLYFEDRIGDTFRWKGENVSTTEVSVACATQIPNVRKLLCMVYLCRTCSAVFDPSNSYKSLTRALPQYAVPVFIRVKKDTALATTSTFKFSKIALQEEGYARSRCGGDMLWVVDHAQQSFVDLTDTVLSKIETREWRL
eukprot:PhM_4_TR10094/c3_g1_i1/m.19677